MANTPAVNVASLTRAATEYDNVLRELPYFVLNESLKKLRINILQVTGEHIAISRRRKGDLLKPYTAGLTLGNQQELMKFFEAKLKPELVYAEVIDNITAYKDKKVISNQGEMVDNKAKKHPLELLILSDIVKGIGEDVVMNLFFAERNEHVLSAATSFTGFHSKLDMLVSIGEISHQNSNLKTTENFVSPTSETDYTSYQKLVEFVKSAHPLLKGSKEVLLYSAENPIECARQAYWKMTKSYQYPTIDEMMSKLRSDANAPGLQLIQDVALGTGDKLTLQVPGLLDLGVNNQGDDSYVQVRSPFKDPNDIQFWVQAAYDTRICDVHAKVFQTNEQVNTAASFNAEYIKTPIL